MASRLLWDISKLICPRSANASAFIRTVLSTSTLPSSARAFNNISVVCAVILPTFVSVVCKFDNFRSLPLVCRSRRPQISGFTFGMISRSQFIGRRYLSDFSLRFVSSSLVSHLKFTILASFSDTFGAVFSVSVRDCVMSSSKESLSSSALVSHVEPLLLSATTLGRLFAAKSASASDSSVSELSPVDGDFRFVAGSAVMGV